MTERFDTILASPARLLVVAALMPGRPLSFMELRNNTGLADGNLHVQTRNLESAGIVSIRKSAQGRRSVTTFQITEAGVTRFRRFVRRLQTVLDLEVGGIHPSPGEDRIDDSQVWS
ncbi:transcriptional regulator [bacterium]|nr:transcriptional regulator [bacterium]MBU1074159.1 transcriptional regulator [bacterium]MBU1675938.1 transcriptional regulator [bacterium]